MVRTMHDPDDVSFNPDQQPGARNHLARILSRRAVLRGGLGAAPDRLPRTPSVRSAGRGRAGGGQRRGPPDCSASRRPDEHGRRVHRARWLRRRGADPWGTPLLSTGPAWKKDGSNTAAEQAQQVGAHHDGMHFFPLGNGRRRGEEPSRPARRQPRVHRPCSYYTDGDAIDDRRRRSTRRLPAHGVSVVEVGRVDGKWRARRLAAQPADHRRDAVAFSGPVPATTRAAVEQAAARHAQQLRQRATRRGAPTSPARRT